MSVALAADVELRARQSLGSSHAAIHAAVVDAIQRHHGSGGRLIDVGCGGGALLHAVDRLCDSYCGLDAVRYDALPAAVDFHRVDLDRSEWPVARGQADVVVAVETIEHLENPWAFVRQLAAVAAPGGLVIVTTPNQLSILSLVTLLVKQRFSAFQDVHYPTHRTALLACDLTRAVTAAGLDLVEVDYTGHGRLPLTAWHYPRWLATCAPRWFSDNLVVVAKRPRP